MTFAFVTACEQKDDSREISSRELAKRFHQSLSNGDIKDIMQIVDVPFILGSRKKGYYETEDALEKAFREKLSSLRRQIQASNRLEVVSYEDFLDGTPIAGKSLEADVAKKRAKVIGFREGGVVVRVYYRNKETGLEDARHYFLVMHDNQVGDLKITTYFH